MPFRKAGPHRRRHEGKGLARYLTFSCFRRRPLLADDEPRRWFVEAVAATRMGHPFDLWAWVIMPEHVHLLLRPRGHVTVGRLLQGIKQPVAVRAVRWARHRRPSLLENMLDRRPDGSVSYHLWQRGGGYDRNLRTPADVYEKVDYIHANPVRRGLAAHPRDWPWSSWSAWHARGEALLPVDRDTLPPRAR